MVEDALLPAEGHGDSWGVGRDRRPGKGEDTGRGRPDAPAEGGRIRRSTIEDPRPNAKEPAEPDPSDRAGRPERRASARIERERRLRLDALPGHDADKRRHRVEADGRTSLIDAREAPAACRGLVLAEVEAQDDESLAAIEPPDGLRDAGAVEVTDDPAYAAATPAAAADSPDALPDAVDLDAAFAAITEPWTPVVAGDLNGQPVELAHSRGAFDRHHHEHADACVLVHRGRFCMAFDDRAVEPGPGQMIVVPRGVPHRPVADGGDTDVILFEPASTLNPGTVRPARTVTVTRRR